MTDRPTPWRLRPATAGDEQAVAACVANAYRAYVEPMGREPAPMTDDYGELIGRGVVDVAEDPGGIAGAIVMWPVDGHLYIDNIAVEPRTQGTGLGSALLELAERRASELGLDELQLYTNEVMVENQAFYPRRGFEEIRRAVDNGYRRIYYRKRLTTPA